MMMDINLAYRDQYFESEFCPKTFKFLWIFIQRKKKETKEKYI